MAPAKKRKTCDNVEKYHCSTCATDRVSSQFPEYNPTSTCEHLINTCQPCLQKWVTTTINDAGFTVGSNDEDGRTVFGVKCPECEDIMRSEDVSMAVTKKVFKKFDNIERKHIAENTPYWRWCLSPTCRAGQVHKPKVVEKEESEAKKELEPKTATMTEESAKANSSRKGKKRKKAAAEPITIHIDADAESKEEPDICICNDCGALACVPCERPWHEGETCAEYRLRVKDRLEEEDKALKHIRLKSKPCPGCKKRIERNGGCPSMNCTQCGQHFCWTCGEAFSQGYCKCSGGRPAGR